MDTPTKARKLKVTAIKDYRKRPKSQLRLEGYWLNDAGIPPECHVIIINNRPGSLTIERINPNENL